MWIRYALIACAMGITFWFGFGRKFPAGIVMAMASAVGMLVSGLGFDIRHLVEGSFYFLNLMMMIATAILFITVLEMSGSFDELTRFMIVKLQRYPSILLCLLMLLVMLPAMLTGSAPVSMLSTGVLVAPILLKLGLPKIQAAAVLAMGGLLGQSAPPVNVMIMIIATSVFMPYEGFDLPLALLCFPMAVFSVLYLGRRYVNRETVSAVVSELEAERRKNPIGTSDAVASLKAFIPLIVLLLIMFAPRMWPTTVPDFGSPFAFVVATIVALFTGSKRVDFVATSKKALKKALGVLGLFVGIGMLVQILSYTGLRGVIAVGSMAVPDKLLYPYVGITAPLIGGPLVPFGASAVVGPPFVLSFTDKNAVIIASAVSMFLSLGCLMPPTALSGLLGARIVGVENKYAQVFRACLLPVVLVFTEAILFMIYANPIGRALGV